MTRGPRHAGLRRFRNYSATPSQLWIYGACSCARAFERPMLYAGATSSSPPSAPAPVHMHLKKRCGYGGVGANVLHGVGVICGDYV